MTAKEAINELKERRYTVSMCSTFESCVRANEALDMAIETLEKRVPMEGKIIVEGKPENGGSYGVRICPSCGKRIDIYGDYIGCPYCLQRVDWSEK